jgi:hypothetical protein
MRSDALFWLAVIYAGRMLYTKKKKKKKKRKEKKKKERKKERKISDAVLICGYRDTN